MDATSPARRTRRPRCRGTVEDHQRVALDVRELIRQRVFERPVGSVLHLTLRYPLLRTMRLDRWSLVLRLTIGHIVTVPWTLARWGALGRRPLFLCPHCRRRVCSLYHLAGEIACRTCGRLWYASQRRSANGRRVLRAQRLRLKLGGEKESLKSITKPDAFPPRPRGMQRKTYERLRRREERTTSRLAQWYWRDPEWSVLLGLR